jgi:exodeoxyribonuclease VII large subunit
MMATVSKRGRDDQAQLPFGAPRAAAPARTPAPAASSSQGPEPLEPMVLSVARLDRLIKRVVEGATGDVHVRGEVSGLRRAGSGHCYFSLKDESEDALIDVVMYRSTPIKAREQLRDGERVVLRGRATLYAPRGRIQFLAEDVLTSGRGALLEALEKLKAQLAAEGLFAAERKKPLPPEPRTIAVLTSRDGAAIHDITRVAFRRGNVRILLLATPVQGGGAGARIAKAIRFIDRVPGIDVIIVTRGGGSAEDLMAYNDEAVVRAIAAATTPIVSAVGHEIDVSLSDLVADHRAATPSQAAELVVPDDEGRRAQLAHLEQRLLRAHRHQITSARERLARLEGKLAEPRRLLLERSQGFDDLEARLERSMTRRLRDRRERLETLRRQLDAQHPRRVLAEARLALGKLEPAMHHAMRTGLTAARHRLQRQLSRLDALSPLAVLSRGYAIASDGSGRVVASAEDFAPGDAVHIRLHRGRVEARVERAEPAEPLTATGGTARQDGS